MDYFCFIQSVVSYIENRLKADVNDANLEKVTGFSLPHAREVFKNCTKTPLARYVLYRKISNAAFEMIHTERNILDIALDYGFESYDTFTRAFKRVTGVTPREFRKNSLRVGRIKLMAGMYGPGIIQEQIKRLASQPNSEEMINMRNENPKIFKKSEDSCILFEVPKVFYRGEECTPFPSTLKACLNYMGQEISYAYLMAASGAAFRLRWNTTGWDGGNVDITCIYENPSETFERSFKAAGRWFTILERKPDVNKNDFIRFIKTEIDEGRPVIALGIIGPPEACIITGYRDHGNTLLGWNFFQDNPEFAKDCSSDESGYFISTSWWDNPNTIAVMALGEAKEPATSLKELLQNAIAVLTKGCIAHANGNYAGGPAAFDAWANALSDEGQFPNNAVLPLLFERLMCQGDAMDMIGEGRAYAAVFLEWVAKQDQRIKSQCLEAAKYFKDEAGVIPKMCELLGGWQRGEEHARKLADPALRKEIVKLILEAKHYEASACERLKTIVENM